MPRILSRTVPLLVVLTLALSLTAIGQLPRAAAPSPASSSAALGILMVPAGSAARHVRDAAEAPDAATLGVALAAPAAALRDLPPPVVNAARGAPSLPAAAPERIPGQGPAMRGTLVVQTERLDVYVGIKTFSEEQVAALAPRLERRLQIVEERFGTTLGGRVSIAFYRPAMAPDRSTRGIAYTEERRAEVYYRPYEDPERAMVVATHELAHHLQAARYGPDVQRRADIVLLEGMATWITGDFWLQRYGAPHWRGRAQQIEASGVPLRLLSLSRYGSDNCYELWASFVDFLVSRYGFEKVDALYRSSASREPGSADYRGITGLSFEELADEWRAWVRG